MYPDEVRALQRAGITPAGTVMIQSVVGEEDGGLGTLATLERGHRGDAAIVLEPTELMIAPAQAGALSFQITVPGLAAHGAFRTEGGGTPWRACPASCRPSRISRPVAGSDSRTPSTTVTRSPSRSASGGCTGVSGPQRYRNRWCSKDATVSGSEKISTLRGQSWSARSERRQKRMTGSRPTGHAHEVRGMPYGADMHLLVNLSGIPTVLFGPGDIRRAHAPDESVPIAELEAATRALVVAILRICGRDAPTPECFPDRALRL